MNFPTALCYTELWLDDQILNYWKKVETQQLHFKSIYNESNFTNLPTNLDRSYWLLEGYSMAAFFFPTNFLRYIINAFKVLQEPKQRNRAGETTIYPRKTKPAEHEYIPGS